MSLYQTIDIQCSKLSQGFRYSEVLTLTGGHRLRVEIVRDSYDFQSSARVERWDGTKWQPVHNLHFGLMQTPNNVYAPKGMTSPDFQADRDTLLKVARSILL